MELEDARELQRSFLTETLPALHAAAAAWQLPFRRDARPRSYPEISPSTLGVGIAPAGRGRGFRLAVRVGAGGLLQSDPIRQLMRRTRGELDVRVVGRVFALHGHEAPSWTQARVRPLVPGISIGHCKVTAGTLGAFVRPLRGTDARLRILSNNHVLAAVNRGRKGDAILQQGVHDGGREYEDRVATLETFKRIRFTGENVLDAAMAIVADGMEVEPGTLRGIGPLAGVMPPEQLFEERLPVKKLGRTTEIRAGRVSAVEVVVTDINFGCGWATFTKQIEIESSLQSPFSRGGDSGSLVVTDDRLAMGLLFAGTDFGGQFGLGLTYANPLEKVLDGLGVSLVIG
jgi:hypothetical protein